MTEHSPTAQDLFDDLAAEHLSQPGVDRRRMFGREGLNVNGKFFVFLNGDPTPIVARGPLLNSDTIKNGLSCTEIPLAQNLCQI